MSFLTSRQAALFSVLAALCIGIQLTPRPPNVEFTSLITFTMGVFFGSLLAGLFGALVMFVNGFFSPWGFAGMIMPFQMAGMLIIGVAGGVYKRYVAGETSGRLCIEAAVLGAFLTLIYDIITNSGTAMVTGIPLILTFFMGIGMSFLHICSNTAFFGFAFIPLVRTLQRFWKR
jgi:hypothetical protein